MPRDPRLHRAYSLAWTTAIALLLTACSTDGGTPAAGPTTGHSTSRAPAPAKLETGRVAFQYTYVAARAWRPDAQPISLESQPTKAANGQDGKAAVWRGTFGSASRQAMKSWSWSGVDAEDAPPEGINPGGEDSWNSNNVSEKSFDFLFLKVDSEDALKTALAHGGKQRLAKEPDARVKYALHWDPRANALHWVVIFQTAKSLAVRINASSGAFERVED
jgi:hypothetical protein